METKKIYTVVKDLGRNGTFKTDDEAKEILGPNPRAGEILLAFDPNTNTYTTIETYEVQ